MKDRERASFRHKGAEAFSEKGWSVTDDPSRAETGGDAVIQIGKV